MSDEIGLDIQRCQEIAQANGFKASIWSVPNTDFNAEHPWKRATILVYESEAFWGEPSGVFIEDIPGPTWLDLWRAADALLQKCGDKHHVYIEGFNLRQSGERVELITGS